MPRIPGTNLRVGPNHGHGYVNGGYVPMSKPVYSKPVYTQKVYSKPVYTQPVHVQTVYSKPAYSKPVHVQPIYTKPVVAKVGPTKGQLIANDLRNVGHNITNAINHAVHGNKKVHY